MKPSQSPADDLFKGIESLYIESPSDASQVKKEPSGKQ